MKRSNKGNSVKRDANGKILIEYIAYMCQRCGAKWKQKIDYSASGPDIIKWIKVS